MPTARHLWGIALRSFICMVLSLELGWSSSLLSSWRCKAHFRLYTTPNFWWRALLPNRCYQQQISLESRATNFLSHGFAREGWLEFTPLEIPWRCPTHLRPNVGFSSHVVRKWLMMRCFTAAASSCLFAVPSGGVVASFAVV